MVIKEFSPNQTANSVKNTTLKQIWKEQQTSRVEWTFKVLNNWSSKLDFEKPALSYAQNAMLEKIKAQIDNDINLTQNLTKVFEQSKF